MQAIKSMFIVCLKYIYAIKDVIVSEEPLQSTKTSRFNTEYIKNIEITLTHSTYNTKCQIKKLTRTKFCFTNQKLMTADVVYVYYDVT